MPSILTHYYFIKDTNKENIPFLENEENACLFFSPSSHIARVEIWIWLKLEI